ncbi:unnamed protein product, partial [Laminaria digitata]
MKRRFMNDRDAFPKSAEEHAQQVVRLLQHRRAVLDAAWAELEEGWKANNERMATLEVRPRTAEEGMVKLNVGGSIVNVRLNLLAETEGFEDSALGALLEGVWGKKRIPRDADGRMVLDESPVCIKHMIHTMLAGRASAVAVGKPRSAAGSVVAIDEAPCHIYTVRAMGLPESMATHPKYMRIYGGSTTMEPFEIAPFSATIREWIGGSADEMTLLYRATRDGFRNKECITRCNKDSPKTVSLIRVSSGQGNDDDTVVGGYSVSPWGGKIGSKQRIDGETFVFKLKDGSATRKDGCQPTKWHPDPCYVGNQFAVRRSDGPYFCAGDFVTTFDKTSGSCTIQTEQEQHHFPTGSSSLFLALNRKKVVEIEVYRYSAATPPTTNAPSTTEPGGGALSDAEAQDIRSFGESIASSLMEEQVVLDRAVKEMEEAGARVSAVVGGLETVYGPSVAAGEQDTVVELNVRGTGMTTLRSTLQACPHSALATMFDAERWPATENDKDEHGRRLIDCCPTCFSKILDVLRMRKRASWSRRAAGRKQQEG